MLLNKHKNYVYVGLSTLGVALTVGMAALGGSIDLLGNQTVSANQLASYGIINAKTVTNASSNGLKSESINFEFSEDSNSGKTVDEAGFSTLNYALRNANEDEPTIYNVHGVSKWDNDNVEFIFESLSPTDYESKVFYQAYTPFTRLASTSGFNGVKYLSTVDASSGERHVVAETKVTTDNVDGVDAERLWDNMLIVLSPIAENTSYNLTLASSNGVTVRGTLSTEEEQDRMMEIDENDNWEAAFSLADYDGVKSVELYMQGGAKSDNTVALTVEKQEDIQSYVKNLEAYANTEDNLFPHDFTTTITVEGEATPAHVFYPGK